MRQRVIKMSPGLVGVVQFHIWALALTFVLISASLDLKQDKQRRELGESKLHELQKKTQSNSCWRETVARLNSTCKKLSDIEQSRLAVAFANCHLAKSGRETYHCNDSMTVQECTEGMDDVAFQTYTEFFTHTGHICYFLQSELWQERMDGVVSKLSDTSTEAVEKLEEALKYHKELDKKQNQALDNQEAILDQDRRIADSLDDTRRSMNAAFLDMNEMAQKQKLLLTEMFGTLHDSVESIRYLMSLFLIEFVGYETFAVFVVSCLVILFLPQFGYSRFKLYLLLLLELMAEILLRKLFGYFVLWGGGTGTRPPPESMETLHSCLWMCRYFAFILGIILYLWEWLTIRDHTHLLSDIQRNTDLIMNRLGIESPPTKRRASAAATMRGSPPPPTPNRHSWPLGNEVPNGSQPTKLTRRGNPTAAGEIGNSSVFSKENADRLVYQPDHLSERFSIQRSAYLHDSIQGVTTPPSDHTHSHQRISQYIASLPTRFSPGEQSFASTTANPPDSDNDLSNNTTILSESESPFSRQPLKRSPINWEAGLNKNKSGGGGASGVSGQVPLNNSLLNVSLGNRQGEWAESEKEVAEEKEVQSDNKVGSSRSISRQRGRSRRTEPVAPPTPTTPTTPRRRTLQTPTPIDTPHRYNLRTRTHK